MHIIIGVLTIVLIPQAVTEGRPAISTQDKLVLSHGAHTCHTFLHDHHTSFLLKLRIYGYSSHSSCSMEAV